MNLDSTDCIKMTSNVIALTTKIENGNWISLKEFYAITNFFAAKSNMDLMGVVYFRYVLETIFFKDTGNFICAKMENWETLFLNVGFKMKPLWELATLLSNSRNQSQLIQEQVQLCYYQILAIILSKYKDKPEYELLKIILNNRVPTLKSVINKLKEADKEQDIEIDPFIENYTRALAQGEEFRTISLGDGLDYSLDNEEDNEENINLDEITSLTSMNNPKANLSKKMASELVIDRRPLTIKDTYLSSGQKGVITKNYNSQMETLKKSFDDEIEMIHTDASKKAEKAVQQYGEKQAMSKLEFFEQAKNESIENVTKNFETAKQEIIKSTEEKKDVYINNNPDINVNDLFSSSNHDSSQDDSSQNDK